MDRARPAGLGLPGTSLAWSTQQHGVTEYLARPQGTGDRLLPQASLRQPRAPQGTELALQRPYHSSGLGAPGHAPGTPPISPS